MGIAFRGFPKTKGAGWLEGEMRRGYRRLGLKTPVEVRVHRGPKRDYGWGCLPPDPDKTVVSVGIDELRRNARTRWCRAAHHEECHVALWDRFGTHFEGRRERGLFSPRAKGRRDVGFDWFLRHQYDELLCDAAYMDAFPELRRYYKPDGMKSLKHIYRWLRGSRERMMRAHTFGDLFYLHRCVSLAERFGEARPKHRGMLDALRRSRRYGPALAAFDKLFERWRLPRGMRGLLGDARRLRVVYGRFVREK